MILVTAANGNQGRLLVPKLLARECRLRACVQSESSAERLRQLGVTDLVVGDISEPEVMRQALDGVEKVYHVGPTLHPREREMGIAMIDAARTRNIRHFVFSSVLHAIATGLVQHEIKRDIEEHLLSSGLEFTILQPANFMLPLKLKPVFEHGIFRLSWSLDRRQSMVDLDDIAEVAAKVLTESARHAGATYELVGAGRYTGYDLGAIISAVLGKPVPVEEISGDTYLKAWFGDVGPDAFPHQARVLRSITSYYSRYDFVGNPNVLTMLLGRAPTTFEQFVRRHHEASLDAQTRG